MATEFAVYKGENILAIGTAKECARVINKTPAYVRWMTTPAGKKRTLKWESNNKMSKGYMTAVKIDVSDIDG